MIQNPKNLYGGDAVLLNSTPYTNFAINQLAQKQATNDALDRYFAEQNSKLNSEGLAPDEVKALLAEKTNFQNDYMKNEDAIHKDDPTALTNVYGHLNKMSEIIGQGKAKAAQSKALQAMSLDPNRSSLLTQQALQNIGNATAPIYNIDPKTNQVTPNSYDPVTNPNGYKNFDFDQHLYNQKPYGANDMQAISSKYWKSVTPDSYKTVNTPLVGVDGHPSTTQFMQHQEGVLSPKTAKSAYQGLINLHDNDPRLQQTVDQGHPFDEMKSEHADDFNTLNAVNQQMLGKDITTNGELYAAQEYLTHDNPHVTVPKPVVDKDAVMAATNQNAMNKMNANDQLIRNRMGLAQHYREAFKDYSTAKNEGEGNNILNNFNNNTYNAGTTKLGNANLSHVTVGGTDYTGKVIQVPKSIADSYATFVGKPGADPKDPSNWKQPDAFYMTNDKKNVIPLYFGANTATGGNYLTSDTKPIPIQNWNVGLSKLLLTKSKTGNEVTNAGDDQSDAANEYGVPNSAPKMPSAPTQSTSSPIVSPTQSFNVKGKKMTKADLNKLGYSDQQINQAIKLGNIQKR